MRSAEGTPAQDGTAFRSSGRKNRRVLLSDNVVRKTIYRSKFKARCKRCETLISPGDWIMLDAELRKFVHRDCAHRLRAVAAQVSSQGV